MQIGDRQLPVSGGYLLVGAKVPSARIAVTHDLIEFGCWLGDACGISVNQCREWGIGSCKC